MNNKVKKLISIVLYCIILICLISIGVKKYNYYKDNKAYDNIREIKNEAEDNNSLDSDKDEGKAEKLKKMYEDMKKVNSDYRFWITIDDTVIDYPVVQGEDNDFYLNNNFYKENSISGTIFLDNKNDELKDKNLILYGHNMRDGSMFAAINKLKENDFFDNGKIRIITENGEENYEVFSVFVEDANSINLKTNFSIIEEYNEYLQNLMDKSYYQKDIKSDFSKIITLYTCSYEFEDARTIVCAVLVGN
ncbi:MAG: class B sortase [Clostridium sp.]|uniref:class B sortase n=1 Tax=Clostridium sp. TaxID=1506 RepID=UPI001EBC3923|nr:class B sortase [Clostridium sp.]MBS5885506.1 class B sortase [Clostridium sp.]MDU7149204.1 class B sortase [Clostridium sp.]